MPVLETQTDATTLYYREGASDKVYQCAIEPHLDRFHVTFAYGRRGTTLHTGVKTPTPVDYDTARDIYDRLVKEKLAKGYSPGEQGVPYQQTERESQSTGILPQLLNPIEEEELDQYLNDPAFGMQEKFDGQRVLIRKEKDRITGINRQGLIIALPATLETEALLTNLASYILPNEPRSVLGSLAALASCLAASLPRTDHGDTIRIVFMNCVQQFSTCGHFKSFVIYLEVKESRAIIQRFL